MNMGIKEKYNFLAVEELIQIRGHSERATTAYLGRYARMASERERRSWAIIQQPQY